MTPIRDLPSLILLRMFALMQKQGLLRAIWALFQLNINYRIKPILICLVFTFDWKGICVLIVHCSVFIILSLLLYSCGWVTFWGFAGYCILQLALFRDHVIFRHEGIARALDLFIRKTAVVTTSFEALHCLCLWTSFLVRCPELFYVHPGVGSLLSSLQSFPRFSLRILTWRVMFGFCI